MFVHSWSGYCPPSSRQAVMVGAPGSGYLLKTAVSVLASTVRLSVSFMPPFITVSVTLSVLSASSSPSELASMATLPGAESAYSGHIHQTYCGADALFYEDSRALACSSTWPNTRWGTSASGCPLGVALSQVFLIGGLASSKEPSQLCVHMVPVSSQQTPLLLGLLYNTVECAQGSFHCSTIGSHVMFVMNLDLSDFRIWTQCSQPHF